MAKGTIPPTYVFVAAVELELYHQADGDEVWECRLLNPLLVVDSHNNDHCFLPAGTVFYLPMGQLDEEKRIAYEAADLASTAFIADKIRRAEKRAGSTLRLDDLPF